MAAPNLPRYPRNHFAITPSNSTKFNFPTTVYVGTTGNVAVYDWYSGTLLTYVAVPAGSTLPVQVERVMSTNTTASDLIGIYE